MKDKAIYIFYSVALLFLVGCDAKKEETVFFREPQPLGIEDAHSFSRKYQGIYRSHKDNARLTISSDKIIKSLMLYGTCSRNDLDSTFKGDKSSNEQVKTEIEKSGVEVIRFQEDSIYFVWTIKDTLFALSTQNTFRYFKGSYFLNFGLNENAWNVQRLNLHKKILTIGEISPGDSLFASIPIKEKSAIKDDSGTVINYQIRPSKKELKKLVKEKAFEISSYWIKEK